MSYTTMFVLPSLAYGVENYLMRVVLLMLSKAKNEQIVQCKHFMN